MPNTSSQPEHLSAEQAKHYEPAALEQHWNEAWEAANIFAASMAADRPNFAIQLPPPNVTGTLHMGHAFNQTIMDGLTRYHRMRGFNTLWQPGTDHAGIATQMVVERQLAAQGLDRHALGREAFIEKVWAWKAQSGNTITQQMRRLGASVDWSQAYFTLDDSRSRAVTEAFVRLYEQGLIYRGQRLVNWDPALKTAVSDLEVDNVETQGQLWHIRYPLSSDPTNQSITVATTRPETMLGDVAVMVHPEDERYRHLIGQLVQLPLTGRNIPIIADAAVDPSFGSGAVKVTPAHDFNDYAVGQRHNLSCINIFNLDATVNEHAPEAFRGLDRFVARERIVAALQEAGLLAGTQAHTLMLPKGDRSGAVLEPMLTEQWFVAMSKGTGADGQGASITEQALKAVERGDIRFYPEQWVNTYNQWLNQIQDWCISRQLWWGHQIPAWYSEQGKVYVARDEAAAQAMAAAAGDTSPLKRDADVLDTWFSSALVPFSALGWPDKTPALDHFLPSSVLVTGFDIIFFWVARMIMMSLHLTGKTPFRDVYVHGLVRDAEGKKMSKSEGNTLDPVDLIDGIDLKSLLTKRTTGLRRPQDAPKIEQKTRTEFPDGIPAYGADALRMTFASLASLGRNINFDQKRCEGYRNFCNKLWNASRFVLMQCADKDCGVAEDLAADAALRASLPFSAADRWIISSLQRTEQAVQEGFASYRFDLIANAIYQFAWDQFCDWYLEIAKIQLAQAQSIEDSTKRLAHERATRRTLIRVMETLLRLTHPLMPYITETLWQSIAPHAATKQRSPLGLCATSAYPLPNNDLIDENAEQDVARLQAWVNAIRALRSEMQLSPAQKVAAFMTIASPDGHKQNHLDDSYAALICGLAKLTELKLCEALPTDRNAPVQVVGDYQFMLDIQIDPAAERARLSKEKERLSNEIAKCQQKLGNAGFVAKAPSQVIEQEKARLADVEQQLLQVNGLLAKLEHL